MAAISFIGRSVDEVSTPALLVDKNVFVRNCQKMIELTEKMGITLRGQTKTHKTIEGALIQTGGTKRGLVVSTLAEAEFYASAGFDDILYGYPLMSHHMNRNFELTKNLQSYHMMVTNMAAVDILKTVEPPAEKQWSVFIKLDCGNARCGIPCEDLDLLLEIGKAITEKSSKILFQGIYVHCGNSYGADSVAGVEKVRDDTIDILTEAATFLDRHGIAVKNWGIGSTPSCSHEGAKMRRLTEIHPGNYVFYDLQQKMLGSCTIDDIAAVIATRVIGHFPRRNQILIDAGFLGMSEQGFTNLGGSYAMIKNFPELAVVKMTQEIGFVEPRDKSIKLDYDQLPIGKMLYLHQYHSCDTAAKFAVYHVHENGIVVEEWRPVRCW